VRLAKAGIPAVVIVTEEFAPLARREREILGVPDLPVMVIAGRASISSLSLPAVEALADPGFAERIEHGLHASPRGRAPSVAIAELGEVVEDTATELDVGSPEDVDDYFYARRWTDGLPIVAPTPEGVARMVATGGLPADELIAVLMPRRGRATVRTLAVNAVMAGCRPEYFPAIIAATRAIAAPEYNLYGIQATTNPASLVLVFNGPVRQRFDINGAYNALGQGWRANATIGRALRLIMVNVGGGTPGGLDRSTLGHPGKYSFCFAEREEENPWEPLHVSRGFDRSASVVTAFGTAGPHGIVSPGSTTGAAVLKALGGAMTAVGNNCLYGNGEAVLVLGPEHAHMLAREGWSRADVRRRLWETARLPREMLAPGNLEAVLQWRPWLADWPAGSAIPVTRTPEDIVLIVAGGAVGHSAFLPSFFTVRSVSRTIDFPEDNGHA
jgi:hypothetical protein